MMMIFKISSFTDLKAAFDNDAVFCLYYPII